MAKFKVSTKYRGVFIEIEDEVDSDDSKKGASLVRYLFYRCKNIEERFTRKEENVRTDDDPEKESWDEILARLDEPTTHDKPEVVDTDYLKPTGGQITYLKKLGVSEAEISKIKTKDEASNMITSLTSGAK